MESFGQSVVQYVRMDVLFADVLTYKFTSTYKYTCICCIHTPVLSCVGGGCRRRWGGQPAQLRNRRGPGSIRSAEGDRQPGILLKRSTAGWSTSPNLKAKVTEKKRKIPNLVFHVKQWPASRVALDRLLLSQLFHFPRRPRRPRRPRSLQSHPIPL